MAKTKDLLKVSSEWLKEYNIKILDPDGWDRSPKNWDYSFNKEKITRREFEMRVCLSTCSSPSKPKS
jgi:hypothetical protein